MNERTDEEEGTGGPSIDALLDRITLTPYGMPVRLMEAVLERGSGITAALAEALERWRDDDEHDALWLVVLLGEIGGSGCRGSADPSASAAPISRSSPRRRWRGWRRSARPPCRRSESWRGRASRRSGSMPMPGSAGSRTIPRIERSSMGSPATGSSSTSSPTALAHHARPEAVPALFAAYQAV